MLEPSNLERLKSSLFAGRYNLLLGSGISLDSTNRHKDPLESSSALAERLCNLKSVRSTTPLSKVAMLLSPEERELNLTNYFSGCRPGPTVNAITKFLWNQAFTFNIDDALEVAYDTNTKRKQTPAPKNFDSSYETKENRGELPVIHLHGWVRDPNKGYIFSYADYAHAVRGLNPWMHVLSELLASEPFVIAGTSLNETDLEYYLSHRNPTSPRKDRGPSILCEPFPDPVTIHECARHGLVLVRATLLDFLTWVTAQLGEAPTVDEMIVPRLEDVFAADLSKLEQVAFYSIAELVVPVTAKTNTHVSPFYYGRAPSWQDMANSLDVPGDDELTLTNHVKSVLDGAGSQSALFVMVGAPGTGKTTCIRRVAYDLAMEGRIVFSLLGTSGIDPDVITRCLNAATKPFVLLTDGIADHTRLVRAIIDRMSPSAKSYVILSAERGYREDHLTRTLSDVNMTYFDCSKWEVPQLVQLIENYRDVGLLGATPAIRTPVSFAEMLKRDSVAVAICRILNDFRPLEQILKSVWNDSSPEARRTYLVAAVAYHCNPSGIFYPILCNAYDNPEIHRQLEVMHPLPLSFQTSDDEYVIPLNSMVADRILTMTVREKKDLVLDVFVRIAKALAPHVNRTAIMRQTPEARLAGRLFDSDKVTRPMLGEFADQFYSAVKPNWEWNSRYWEQRALLIQDRDVDTSVQYARHAVAIEEHPFTWTTLAGLLTRKFEKQPAHRDGLFDEAFELLNRALKAESNSGRQPAPHAFVALFHTTNSFLDLSGVPSPKKRDYLKIQIEKAQMYFKPDAKIQEIADALLLRLK